jgi:hypothetical protein
VTDRCLDHAGLKVLVDRCCIRACHVGERIPKLRHRRLYATRRDEIILCQTVHVPTQTVHLQEKQRNLCALTNDKYEYFCNEVLMFLLSISAYFKCKYFYI